MRYNFDVDIKICPLFWFIIVLCTSSPLQLRVNSWLFCWPITSWLSTKGRVMFADCHFQFITLTSDLTCMLTMWSQWQPLGPVRLNIYCDVLRHRRYNKQIWQQAESCCQASQQQWYSVTLNRSHVTSHLYTKIMLSKAFKICTIQMLRLYLGNIRNKNNLSEINKSICIITKMKITLIKVISKYTWFSHWFVVESHCH